MLQELFVKCVSETNGNKTRGAQRFLVAAKAAKPDVTIVECMEITGHTDKDSKKAVNFSQNFRNTIFNPTRDFIAAKKFNVMNTEEIFGRSGVARTPEQIELREKILAFLPSRTRSDAGTSGNSVTKMESYLGDLLG